MSASANVSRVAAAGDLSVVLVITRGRTFFKELDLTPDEWRSLLHLSARLKADKHNRTEEQHLAGKYFALIFEKASTRTRSAREVAAHDRGAHVTYLDPTGSHIGAKESAADTARVLGRMYDAIEYRGFSQGTAETSRSSLNISREPSSP